jgi:CRISPR-associated protein Cmr2
MSHLLALAVGPVQEFIAAARRTRDLWFGSYLLSEISKAVAQSVQDHGGRLIFPHPETDLTSGDDQVNVANVILAELPTGEPKTITTEAKRAAETCWHRFADEAYTAALKIIRPEVWYDQVEDVIEFYAAWVPATSDYRTDRQKLMRLLAGRKNLRDFLPAQGRDQGLPKSSLDGQRPTVLQRRRRFPSQYRIREGEQLDVVGLVKRVASGSRPYPSVSRVAADPWVRGNSDRLQPVISACRRLGNGVIRSLNVEPERGHPHFQAFPYEGTAVYTSRHHELIEEAQIEQNQLRDLQNALTKFPEPNPYLAVLVADGDKMGAAISALTSPDANREFSRDLAGFANSARAIVNDHNGVLVYAGGDDVLAFLPVDQCLACARALRDQFIACLKSQVPENTPTLSVGIAIGHFLENLEDLLDYGRAAEKAAKGVPGKDALAVHLHKRGGSPIQVAARWETKPEQRLTLYAELMQHEALPSKLPYDLMKLIEIYQADGWPVGERRQAMQRDALRIIADKQPRAGRRYMPTIREIVSQIQTVKDLQQFCDKLLIARQLAAAFEQSQREPSELQAASANAEASA